jgi:hypothetical protein
MDWKHETQKWGQLRRACYKTNVELHGQTVKRKIIKKLALINFAWVCNM